MYYESKASSPDFKISFLTNVNACDSNRIFHCFLYTNFIVFQMTNFMIFKVQISLFF